MPKQQEQMSDPFAPGNIVKLRQPYKPDGLDRAWLGRRPEWRTWPGYTHGIVAEVLSRDFRSGYIERVSLHLFDPEQALLYFHDNGGATAPGSTVPVYVDHHVDELYPHKIATDQGYATLPEL